MILRVIDIKWDEERAVDWIVGVYATVHGFDRIQVWPKSYFDDRRKHLTKDITLRDVKIIRASFDHEVLFRYGLGEGTPINLESTHD